jgi:hypothetical protein
MLNTGYFVLRLKSSAEYWLDLTVKSAATPDFLLENLPETFIGK